jgi:N-acetylmuramoyl-L-alanine amidase
VEDAIAADCRRTEAEAREKELLASNAALERQVQARRVALSMLPREAPPIGKEILERDEALMLEALEHSLELERLEVREHQVAAAEDAVTAREARIQQEVDRKVERAREAFMKEHRQQLELRETRFQQWLVMGLAKDAANLEVAMKENEVILLENDHSTKYEGFDPKSPESYIMFTLMQNTYQKQSTEFASRIQSQFRDGITRRDRGVKQAGFWVLFTTTMPSVLIETGFITNLTEEKYLTSKVGQDHLASSIYKACKDYINEINRRSGISASDIIASPILSDSQKVEQVTIPVSDLRFLVQIANSRTKTEIKPENFKGLKDVTEISIQDRFRYVSGSYADYETAVSHRKMIESYYPDAFVIAIKDNKILPLQKALEQVRNERNKTTNND